MLVIVSYLYISNYTNKYYYKQNNIFLYKNINIIYLIIAFLFILILFLTYLPLFSNLFFNSNISIGYSFFNKILLPFAISIYIYLLLFYINNYLQLLLNILIQFFTFFIIYKYDLYSIEVLLMNLALIGLIQIFVKIQINKYYSKSDFSHLYLFAMTIVISLSSLLKEEIISIMLLNDNIVFNNINFFIKSINYYNNLNYNSNYFNICLENILSGNNSYLYAEKKTYFIKQLILNKSCIYNNIINDVYLFVGDGNYKNGWYLRLVYQPLVPLL